MGLEGCLVDGIVLGHQGDACVEPRQPIDEFPSRHCRTQHQALVQHRNEGAAKERGRAGRGLRLREEIGISSEEVQRRRAVAKIHRSADLQVVVTTEPSPPVVHVILEVLREHHVPWRHLEALEFFLMVRQATVQIHHHVIPVEDPTAIFPTFRQVNLGVHLVAIDEDLHLTSLLLLSLLRRPASQGRAHGDRFTIHQLPARRVGVLLRATAEQKHLLVHHRLGPKLFVVLFQEFLSQGQ
mmetsp:Transcript_77501/g.171199  ORF Transcript_77501/g.171199 Transcript_77501/m.171199 type:complete len:240 (-) Transcript_77501:179-898(-)